MVNSTREISDWVVDLIGSDKFNIEDRHDYEGKKSVIKIYHKTGRRLATITLKMDGDVLWVLYDIGGIGPKFEVPILLRPWHQVEDLGKTLYTLVESFIR